MGWTKGYGGGKLAGAGESDAPCPTPNAGAANNVGGYNKGKKTPGFKQGGDQDPKKKKGFGPILVCYHCKKSGHVWTECRTKPEGWEPKDEDKAAADKMRADRIAQSNAAKAKTVSGEGSASAARSNPDSIAKASPPSESKAHTSKGVKVLKASEGKVSRPEV